MIKEFINIKEFKDYIRTHGFCENCECAIKYPKCLDLCGLGSLFVLLDETPMIEAKPVVHAHWEKEFFTNERQRVCSACFATVRQTLYDDGEPRLFKHCPWCGAQMDEEIK